MPRPPLPITPAMAVRMTSSPEAPGDCLRSQPRRCSKSPGALIVRRGPSRQCTFRATFPATESPCKARGLGWPGANRAPPASLVVSSKVQESQAKAGETRVPSMAYFATTATHRPAVQIRVPQVPLVQQGGGGVLDTFGQAQAPAQTTSGFLTSLLPPVMTCIPPALDRELPARTSCQVHSHIAAPLPHPQCSCRTVQALASPSIFYRTVQAVPSPNGSALLAGTNPLGMGVMQQACIQQSLQAMASPSFSYGTVQAVTSPSCSALPAGTSPLQKQVMQQACRSGRANLGALASCSANLQMQSPAPKVVAAANPVHPISSDDEGSGKATTTESCSLSHHSGDLRPEKQLHLHLAPMAQPWLKLSYTSGLSTCLGSDDDEGSEGATTTESCSLDHHSGDLRPEEQLDLHVAPMAQPLLNQDDSSGSSTGLSCDDEGSGEATTKEGCSLAHHSGDLRPEEQLDLHVAPMAQPLLNQDDTSGSSTGLSCDDEGSGEAITKKGCSLAHHSGDRCLEEQGDLQVASMASPMLRQVSWPISDTKLSVCQTFSGRMQKDQSSQLEDSLVACKYELEGLLGIWPSTGKPAALAEVLRGHKEPDPEATEENIVRLSQRLEGLMAEALECSCNRDVPGAMDVFNEAFAAMELVAGLLDNLGSTGAPGSRVPQAEEPKSIGNWWEAVEEGWRRLGSDSGSQKGRTLPSTDCFNAIGFRRRERSTAANCPWLPA